MAGIGQGRQPRARHRRLPGRRSATLAVLLLALAACTVAPRPRTGPYHASDAPVSITRIVHGSYVVDFAGTRILVDPWYYPRGLVNQAEPLGLTFRTLPAIAAIVITHGHRDHLDVKALAALPDRAVPVVVPPGLAGKPAEIGYTGVVELAWWDTTHVGDIAIQAVPTDHGGTGNGYILERGGVTVYAAGATRYFAGLQDIATRVPTIDIALLPIGGLRFFGMLTEMRPEDAARAVELLAPRRVIPVHYGLVGPLPIYWRPGDPVGEFRAALEARGLGAERLVAIETGESWHYYSE